MTSGIRACRPVVVLVAMLGLVLTACSGSGENEGVAPGSPTGSSPSSGSGSPAEPSATATESSTSSDHSADSAADRLPSAASDVSLPAMMRRDYDGKGLRLGRVLASTGDYVRHAASYRSDGLRISGIMNIPSGRGPFPVLVLLHGYIDPAYYVTGQGLMREQDYLAREGYAVLHIDYRNHAGSDADPAAERRLRLGYTADTINAVLAVKKVAHRASRRRPDRAARPVDGWGSHVQRARHPAGAGQGGGGLRARQLADGRQLQPVDPRRNGPTSQPRSRAGTGHPGGNPRFWREVSPRPYFDRVTEPLLIHHGTSDDSCPIRWTRASYGTLKAAGKDAKLYVYDGEEHAFGPQWPLSMRRTVRFLDRAMAS